VNAANPDAVEFYKKWGFKVLSRDGGSAENILLMERKLGENGCL